ncbi:hypothetical protein DERF_002004 [Dermatophagoides farinae]|uniref:Uncharacterized protein n=1 Tax=Dermatophagoides farinae TaxID=6954 RepID=A0A922IDG8_DERFA|nr:hypothetical protein DERF_002004 [Dermatophagoides farinae]
MNCILLELKSKFIELFHGIRKKNMQLLNIENINMMIVRFESILRNLTRKKTKPRDESIFYYICKNYN